MVLEGEKEREGSAMNPCLIIVDTSLDAIERSKVSNFLQEFSGKVPKRIFAGKLAKVFWVIYLKSETRRKTREGEMTMSFE